MGVAEHERLIKQASLTNVDLIQTTNTSKVMLDQGFADLVDEVAGPRCKDCQRVYEETVKAALDPYSRETAGHPAEAGGRRTASKTGKTVRRRTPAAAPGAATEMTTPEDEGARLGAKVSGRPSIGTKVAVPRETWPDYDCREMGGRAWQHAYHEKREARPTSRGTRPARAEPGLRERVHMDAHGQRKEKRKQSVITQ